MAHNVPPEAPSHGVGEGGPDVRVAPFQAATSATAGAGNGADVFGADPTGRSPADCSPVTLLDSYTLTNGRAVVFDAPLLPTSKEQCKNGGWRNFAQFKHQGDCVSFVETGR
jgi:hypothetical protein